MSLVFVIILLMVSLLLSYVIGFYTPFLPTALVQIALGIILALLFPSMNLELETEWFLLLFIAPLLFNDGRTFSRESLWNLRTPILANAIVLVLVTTIAGGYFIHWLIPAIPLAPAFALAAILSPTDPVAVNGIAKRVHIPNRILNIVRGESLINDASGLIAFKYAVTAAVTGYFSIKEATLDFSYTFLVGAIIGFISSLLLIEIRFMLRRAGIRDAVFHSLFQLLIPFLIYIIAEDLFHASGVIAVVIGGIVHALVKDRTEIILAEEVLLTENVWSIVLFILNGIVFLLLGMNIPFSMEKSIEDTNYHNFILIGYGVLIGIFILFIRFIWSYVFNYFEYKQLRDSHPTMKSALLSSLVGVRGAVTMAGVLSLPYFLEDGSSFPERSLILFLASAVILFTLLAATFFLPLITDNAEETILEDGQLTFNEAKRHILIAAIKKVEAVITDENRRIAYEMIDDLQNMFQQLQLEENAEENRQHQQEVMKLRMYSLQIEKSYYNDLFEQNHLDEAMYNALLTALSERAQMIQTNAFIRVLYSFKSFFRYYKTFRKYSFHEKENFYSYIRMRQEVRRNSYTHVLRQLREERKQVAQQQKVFYSLVIFEYEKAAERLRKSDTLNTIQEEEIREEMNTLISEVERNEIHNLYVAQKISREQEKDLRRFITYIESMKLYEITE